MPFILILYLIVAGALFISFVFYNRYKKLFTSQNMISSDKEELFVIILLGIILWPIVIAGLIAFAIGYLLYKLIVPKK